MDIVAALDNLDLNGGCQVRVHVCKWIAPALDAAGYFTTEPLHRESPVAPHRPHLLDAVGHVHEVMDGDWAHRETILLVLVVNPGNTIKERWEVHEE